MLHRIMFASSLEGCRASFPKVDGQLSLDQLRTLLSRFTIVGKRSALHGGKTIDIGRTGMLHGVTEQVEFILAQTGVQPSWWDTETVETHVQGPHGQTTTLEAMNILLGRRSDQDGATAVDDAFGASDAAIAPTPAEDITNIDDLPTPTVDEDLFAAPPTPTALIEHGPSFHGNDDGVGHSNEVASESDHGLVDDPPVLTSLVCCTCGAEHFVLPRRAAALAASRVDFSCIFQRAGGCVSNLRRRKR